MQNPEGPFRDLVLVGGGHAHLGVLRRWGMRPEPGVRLTLVARETLAAYSGMVPGVVAGLHTAAEAQLDLRALARQAGARLIHAEAEGLDLPARRVLLRGRPPLRFDVLSLDVGASPRLEVPGAAEHALPVWPLDGMLARVTAALAAGPTKVVVVGGGAGGVELALALRTRLGAAPGITLCHGSAVLPGHGGRGRSLAESLLAERGIAQRAGSVARVEAGAVLLADGWRETADLVLWATGAAPVPWLRESGLALDERGFLAVLPTLQSTSHPIVFAAGDCATVLAHVRPKAGVYAVRQGPPLAENLRLALRGGKPRPFVPQRRALFLLNGADGTAVASYGPFAARRRWAWRWKRWIDLRWMAKLRAPLEPMKPPAAMPPMRCAGCAAKVPGPVLARVMARLSPGQAPQDAAELPLPLGARAVQTVDMFRVPVDDPWLAGRIAAAHALGDLFASGARPVAALAMVSLPPAGPALLEEELFQLLAGATSVLEPAGAPILGGHSAEGLETALGFALTGVASGGVGKGGLRVGDALILTKPLGTGVVLAGAMQGLAEPAWVEAALASMQRDGGTAAAVLRAHGVVACTDVTGFGLAGHLGEMLSASGFGARVRSLPALPGAEALLAKGVRSTAHGGNLAYAASAWLAQEPPPLALDPQTTGPLLAGVPPLRAKECVAALHAAGEVGAVIIGQVVPGKPSIRFG